MKSGNGISVIEQLKAEMTAQSEGQDEVFELVFENINIRTFTPEITKLFQKYTKLISLEFCNCKLTSLEGFPQVKSLVKLSLESNQLQDDSVDYIVDHFPELQFLSLSENQISSLDTIKKLGTLNDLVQLDVQDNPIAKLPGYQKTLFSACQRLEILDNKDKDGNSVHYSSEDEEDFDEDLDEDLPEDDDDEDDDDDNDDDEEEDKLKKMRK